MGFLSINGIELDAAVGSYSESSRTIGEMSPAYNGDMRLSRQDIKFDITLETPPLLQSDAIAWDGLIRGLGHRWSFDSNLYSSKGLKPTAGYTAVAVTAGSAKHGAGRLNLDPTTATITYATALGSTWTVGLWWSTDGGATYTQYVVNSSGQKWVDGVRNDAAVTTFLSVSSGSLTVANTAGGDRELDDMWAYPFVMPTTWPPLAYTFHNGSAWSDIPKLTVQGDAIGEGTRSMLGDVSTARFIKAVIDGSFRTNGRVLSVALTEV